MDFYVPDPPRKRGPAIKTESELEDWVAEIIASYNCEWDVALDVARNIIRRVRQLPSPD